MSYEIKPREVLAYLNELGYRNISAQQLKDFLKDLKKLIKYDLKLQKLRSQENIENECPNVFQSLYETGTASSKAKEVPRKDKVITVQIKKPVRTHSVAHVEDKNSQLESITAYPNSTSDYSQVTGTSVLMDANYETKTRPKSSNDVHRDNEFKPKASFIRPRNPLKPCKSDPVALYHQYQAEWKKQKFPGEENYSNLRWAIRERMLGEPQEILYRAPSVDLLSKKRCNAGRT